jgi:uncharacterized membrane protein YvbJ
MFCAKCGTQLSAGSIFCGNCGNKIGSASSMNEKSLLDMEIAKSSIIVINDKKIPLKDNTMLFIGFILGLCSTFLYIVGVLACVFSVVGLVKFNSKTENNKWMGILGIILGIYSLYKLTQLQDILGSLW